VKVKGSRFLGQVFRATDERQIHGHLHSVRKRHHSASHHCWASRTGLPDSALERFDDAGEPSGTAGRPILNQIHSLDLFDVLVVVARYFGGTKLGTGGLARAYAEAASLALDATAKRIVTLEETLYVDCSFDDIGAVEAAIARAGADVREVERDYGPSPRLSLHVVRSRADAILAVIVDATSGRATVKRSEDS
jgi:uncharacterized YigZ family protein